jgi:hypothetical protein
MVLETAMSHTLSKKLSLNYTTHLPLLIDVRTPLPLSQKHLCDMGRDFHSNADLCFMSFFALRSLTQSVV